MVKVENKPFLREDCSDKKYCFEAVPWQIYSVEYIYITHTHNYKILLSLRRSEYRTLVTLLDLGSIYFNQLLSSKASSIQLTWSGCSLAAPFFTQHKQEITPGI